MGENKKWAKLIIQHSKEGLEINVRAVPEIEQFFARIANGQVDSLDSFGPNWGTKDNKLEVYRLKKGLNHWGNYTLGHPGRDLIIDGDMINLSFLRLKGISDDMGVVFTVDTVMSWDEKVKLKSKLGNAIKQFCMDYVMPHKMRVVVEEKQNV